MIKVNIVVFILLLAGLINLFAQENNYFNNFLKETPPDSIPVLFARGIISTEDYEHSSPAFSPSFDEIYWSVRINGEYGKEIIKYISKKNNDWSEPQIDPFSIMGNGDLYPTFSFDGKELFFTSDRFVPNSTDSINRFIWKIKKNGTEWSEPEVVGFDSLDIYGLSISSKGTIYFMAQENKDRGSRNFDIYYSKIEDEKYNKPVKIEYPISTESYEDCPFISSDERFLIFESNRPGGFGKLDLYISNKDKDGNWTEPINLGKLINSEAEERFPYISPDGKYFFFGSNRTGNFDIYWINATVIYNTINYLK